MCSFIDSLVEGNYDEYGEIVLTSPLFDFNNWYQFSEYKKFVQREVYPIQIVGLVVSAVLMVGLGIYAICLHRQIVHFVGGTPLQKRKRERATQEASRLSRINSGITMMRSTSGSSYLLS
jgi:hypothetical protein